VLERELSRTREQLLIFCFAVVRSAEERKSEWATHLDLHPDPLPKGEGDKKLES